MRPVAPSWRWCRRRSPDRGSTESLTDGNTYCQHHSTAAPEYVLVQEEQGAERLVLRGRGDVAGDRQVGQEGVHLRLGHRVRVADAVEPDEPLGPVVVRGLGADAVVADAAGGPEAVGELRR